jgi:Holliday junction resolvasome RuvABC ATP-dependent DNA helicase subunit
VLAVDIDYWQRKELLEIPRLGSEKLGIHIDQPSLTMFATEAAGSPQLMQSICRWMCHQLGVREAVSPPRAVTLDEANAVNKVDQQSQARMSSVMSGVALPPGFKLPF